MRTDRRFSLFGELTSLFFAPLIKPLLFSRYTRLDLIVSSALFFLIIALHPLIALDVFGLGRPFITSALFLLSIGAMLSLLWAIFLKKAPSSAFQHSCLAFLACFSAFVAFSGLTYAIAHPSEETMRGNPLLLLLLDFYIMVTLLIRVLSSILLAKFILSKDGIRPHDALFMEEDIFSAPHIFARLAFIGTVFIMLHFMVGAHWAFTATVCLNYATNFSTKDKEKVIPEDSTLTVTRVPTYHTK